MKRFFITGISGVGKSSVAEKLKEKGVSVIDLDRTEDRLTNWRNNDTSEISQWYSGIGGEFFEQHSYICDREKLIDLMSSYSDKDFVVVVGLADNQSDILDLFDKIFLFQCNEKTFMERIDQRTSHDFGKHGSEKEIILGWYKDFEKEMLDKGAIPINTEESLELVVEKVIKNIKS